MTPEERYHLDVFGYLVVPGLLDAGDVASVHARLEAGGDTDGWPDLYEHPVLAAYVHELCGEQACLDDPVQLPAASGQPLAGGNEPLDWKRGYGQQNEVQLCNRLVVVFVLRDEGSVRLVPGSHKSLVDTPAGVRDGTKDMGLTVPLTLAAGDVLLCVASTLHAIDGPGLLSCQFVADEMRRRHANPETDVTPPWAADLPAATRAIATPSSGGPTPTVRSDGHSCRVETAPFHPGLYRFDPDDEIDPAEFYHWDLCGHLVLRGVMDADWVAQANEALTACADRVGVGGAPHRDSPRLHGGPLASLNGLFELPAPHAAPFQRMIAHPPIVQRLTWMMGSGFRLGPTRAMVYEPDSSGLFLHGGGEPLNNRHHYAMQNGRAYCQSVNVAWQLVDADVADGGFVFVPGSHKARYPTPPGVELPDDDMGMVRGVALRAGDVALFLGAAQTHGALPWRGATQRRVALLNYRSASRS